ncbi:MAG: PEP-CTERM sorting domain-containing protein [Desulforegulaceae bacterium]|nr:PEP-CTERM sorting domain-containing protein [Desulforegulaceae bacterium]
MKKYDFMKQFKIFLCGFLLSFILVINVYSASYDFLMGEGSYIDISGTQNFLEFHSIVNPKLTGFGFTLNEGESREIKFGKVWTEEKWINDDDICSGIIKAYLDFDSPELIQAVGGTSIGFEAGFFNCIEGWRLNWNNPEPISFGNGGLFSIILYDLKFESLCGPDGCFLNPGKKFVFAEIELIKAPIAHSPEPSTMILFGLGLLCFAGLASGKKFRKN